MWNFLRKKKSPNTNLVIPGSGRLEVANVVPGNYIVIEYSGVLGGLATVKCLNNDPVTKKILVEIEWRNFEELKHKIRFEQMILDYDSSYLANFHLLNSGVSHSVKIGVGKSDSEDKLKKELEKIGKEIKES